MLGRLATVLAIAACCLGALLAPAAPADAATAHGAACGPTTVFESKRAAGPSGPPLVIGDSVMLGAAKAVAALGYTVDVRGCRMADEGIERLLAHARERRLPRFVVIALGSNSDVTGRDVRRLLRILGPRRRLGLVTPNEIAGTPPRDARTMRRMARRYGGRIVLVDWARRSARRNSLTASDGIHLTFEGTRAMKRLLRRALRRAGQPGAPPATEPPPVESENGGAKAPSAAG